jgi:hypothetical protein
MLTNLDGWLFKKGNDTNWAKNNIDVTLTGRIKTPQHYLKNLQTRTETRMLVEVEDKVGYFFRDTPVDLFIGAWAAVDLMLMRICITVLETQGSNGKPFNEYNPTYKLPIAFHNIEKGIDHVLAISFVDYTSSLPRYRLKSGGMA